MTAETNVVAGQRAPLPASVGADQVAVPLVEEHARIDKHEVEAGRVRVTTHTDLVEEHFRQSLRSDDVEIMRVPIGRTLDPGEVAPTIRTEGDVTIIPVLEEILVVEKRLVLKEELHILRETRTEEVEVPVTLRKQRAEIERMGPTGLGTSNEETRHGLT